MPQTQILILVCECIPVITLQLEYIRAPVYSLESVTYTYWNCIEPTRAHGSFMNSFTFAFEPISSVYTLSTVLARVGNTWMIHYNKHILYITYTLV